MEAFPAQVFLSLFAGYDKAFGQWDPSKPRRSASHTVSEPLTLAQVEAHLEGKVGLGIVPIREDDTCSWGVLDVDAHDETHHIDLDEAEAVIREAKLPLLVCQSKSRGAHLFLFLRRPLAARLVQSVLKDWSKKLKISLRDEDGRQVGTAVIEVFPKQIKQQGVGNWLNLPYFNASDTNRFAYNAGKKLTLDEFLAAAERIKQEREDILQAGDIDLSEAPPCLQALWEKGAPAQSRDNTLFAYATYFRKQGVHDLFLALQKVNGKPGMMNPRPMLQADVKKIANSVARREYRYRCNESPMCDNCDSAVCKTRKYGITVAPTKEYSAVSFGDLQKVMTVPPRWQFNVNGNWIELQTEELMSFELFRRKVVEALSLVLPPAKQEEWLVQLGDYLDRAVEVEAPDDANASAIILSMLDEFTSTAEEKAAVAGAFQARSELLRGLPVPMTNAAGAMVIGFRSQDFISFLKRKKVNGVERGQDLWMTLRRAGCDHERITVEGRKLQVWTKPITQGALNHQVPEVKTEF